MCLLVEVQRLWIYLVRGGYELPDVGVKQNWEVFLNYNFIYFIIILFCILRQSIIIALAVLELPK